MPVVLNDTGFTFGGCQYANEQVSSLYFYHLVTDVRVNLLHHGNDHQADLDIYLEGDKNPIEIRASGLFTSMASSEFNASLLEGLYRRLAERTFRFRMQRHIHMVEEHGYFYYDNKQFFADGRVSDGKREINLKTDGPIYRKPFMVYFKTKKTLSEKFMHLWKLQDFIISTRRDADVFFALVDSLYGLRWKAK